jgi:hypothetical protein
MENWSDELKEEISSKLLGISRKSLKYMMSKDNSTLPCLYLCSLGEAKNFHKQLKLPADMLNDFMVMHHGISYDLEETMRDLTEKYSQLDGVNLQLTHHTYIDPKYLSDAEMDINESFEMIETPIKHKKITELVAISSKHLTDMVKTFKYITNEYGGCVRELINKVKMMEKHMVLLKKDYQIELQEERHKNQQLESNHRIKQLEKDQQIKQLKKYHRIEQLEATLEKKI